jgi:choline-sulfatase
MRPYSSKHLRLSLGVALCAALSAACSTANVENAALRSAKRTELADWEEGMGAAPARARSGAASASARGRVIYDLLAHPEHAEGMVGDASVIDFGVPGDEKNTLGGWVTRVQRHEEVDGASVALLQGTTGDLHFGLLAAAHTPHLHLRVRAPRDGDLTLLVDDKEAKRVHLDRGAFSVVSLAIPSAQVKAGEHVLRLRATGTASLGKHTTGAAIDWLAISESPEPPLVPGGRLVDAHVRPEAGLSYLIPAEAASVIALRAEASEGAQLQVTVVDETGTRHALGKLPADGRERIHSLAKHAGQVVRLQLSADRPVLLRTAAVLDTEPLPHGPSDTPPPRNVLIYLIDTLRADHLRPFNPGTRVRAPGLDALVELGSAVFTSAHTQENWTKPSVATLLSSLFPWEHHAVTTEAVVPDEVQLLPERLGQKGFYTGAFIANGYVSDKFGFKQGWDTYRNYIREGRYSRAEFLAADVLGWLDKRPKEKPFFLYVHAIDPHVPYKPTAKFLSLYDPNPYSGIVDFSHDNELLEKVKGGKITLNARDKTHLEALYDSEISYHDVHFHAIMEALERRELSGDTMIVVVADHGEEFWDHGSVGHGHSVYEELIRIPMVIRVPGLTRSVKVPSSSGLVDIVPTVFDALGQPRPQGLSGRSLMPELRGTISDAPPVALAGFMDGFRAIVVGKRKLIQRSDRRFTLHDLQADPSEQRDVSAARPLTTRYLRGQLGLALAATNAGEERARKPIKQQTTQIDAQTEAQLRALGYVGSSRR